MNTFLFLILLTSLAAAQPRPIVCFGDSTTAPRPGVITYCDNLKSLGYAILNRGIPGNTTAQARLRFANDVLAAQPAAVIIQFGLNDSTIDVWKTPPASTPRVSLTEFTAHLRHFLASLAPTPVALLTFNPLTWTPKLLSLYGKPPYDAKPPEGFNAGREPYLATIRTLAREFPHVTLIDIHAAYTAQGPAQLLPDGMHPNTAGHSLTTSLLVPWLEKKGLAPHAHQ